MKKEEITSLSVEQIGDKIIDLKAKLHGLKIQNSISSLDNFMEIRKVRKDIARLFTEKTKKQSIEK